MCDMVFYLFFIPSILSSDEFGFYFLVETGWDKTRSEGEQYASSLVQEFYNNGGQERVRTELSPAYVAWRADTTTLFLLGSFLSYILSILDGPTILTFYPLGLALPVLKNGKDIIRTCFLNFKLVICL